MLLVYIQYVEKWYAETSNQGMSQYPVELFATIFLQTSVEASNKPMT